MIPDVIGKRLERACPAMSAAGYSGGIRAVLKRGHSLAGSVLSLGTPAGTHGFEGEVIMMKVAGPVDLKRLPRGCVSRLPGTF